MYAQVRWVIHRKNICRSTNSVSSRRAAIGQLCELSPSKKS